MASFKVGVSWSAGVLRIVSFRKSGSSFILSDASRILLADTHSDSIHDALSQWTTKHIPEGSLVTAVVTIPESTIFIKELEVPKGTHAEITEAIRWELLTKNAQFPKDAVVAWQQLGTSSGAVKVAAYAIRDSDSENYYTILSDLQWQLTGLEPVTVSLSRFVKVPSDYWVCLEIDGNQASLSISHGRTPLFATLIDLAQTTTAILENRLSVETMETITSKIRQNIIYWEEKSGKKISQIYCVADAASVRLVNYVGKVFKIPVKMPGLTRTKGFAYGKQNVTALSQFAHNIGAVLRTRSYAYDTDINFLPAREITQIQDRVKQSQNRWFSWQVTHVNLLLSLLCIGLLGLGLFMRENYQRQISQNKLFIEKHPAQAVLASVRETNELLATIQTLMKTQKDTGEKLAFFAQNTPPGITYTSIKYVNQAQPAWTIEGTGDRDQVLAFYYQLNAQSQAKEVSMPYSSLQKEKAGAFRITILW